MLVGKVKKPIGKGKHLIIVHAGGETVFVPNGLLISIRYLNLLVQWWTKKTCARKF
jgi:hypothetical protein